MKIERIKLHNFRQYIDTDIVFSNDPSKNITIVIGENGYGKTTMIRAFCGVYIGLIILKIKSCLIPK